MLLIVRITIGCLFGILCFISASCSDPYKKAIDDSISDWRVHKLLQFGSTLTDTETLIDEDSKVVILGFDLEFSFVKEVDSKWTKKTYWDRRLGSVPSTLTDREIIERNSMLGGSGIIYPFSGSSGNFGYLIADKEMCNTWCRLWSPDTKWSAFVSVDRSQLEPSQCKAICQELSQLKWAYSESKKVSEK